jgi:hypothetical protein
MSEQSIEPEIIRLEEAILRITKSTNINEEISKCGDRCGTMETEVRKIIEDCKPEWFVYFHKGVPKLNHILYHIS